MLTADIKKFISRNWTRNAADFFNMLLEEPADFFKLSQEARKRIVKHANRDERPQPRVFPELLNAWTRETKNGESWRKVWIINAKSKAHAKHIMYQRGYSPEGWRINSAYDCTGQTFAYGMNFYKVKGLKRVIITQTFAIDC